jgi:hypothetical protein
MGLDAAICARATSRSSSVPAWSRYPRHPVAVAQQALTAQAAARSLHPGIGLSRQLVIQGMYGMSFAKPYSHMGVPPGADAVDPPVPSATPAKYKVSINLNVAGAAPCPCIAAPRRDTGSPAPSPTGRSPG